MLCTMLGMPRMNMFNTFSAYRYTQEILGIIICWHLILTSDPRRHPLFGLFFLVDFVGKFTSWLLLHGLDLLAFLD